MNEFEYTPNFGNLSGAPAENPNPIPEPTGFTDINVNGDIYTVTTQEYDLSLEENRTCIKIISDTQIEFITKEELESIKSLRPHLNRSQRRKLARRK